MLGQLTECSALNKLTDLLSPIWGVICSYHVMSYYVFINVAKRFVIPLQGEKLLWKTP